MANYVAVQYGTSYINFSVGLTTAYRSNRKKLEIQREKEIQLNDTTGHNEEGRKIYPPNSDNLTSQNSFLFFGTPCKKFCPSACA